MYQSWSGFKANEYKEHKGLGKKNSLRDNMTPLELATTIFSEATAKELIEKTGASNFFETKKAIHIAGTITKEAIQKLELQTGKKVVTHESHKNLDSPEVRNKLIQESVSNDSYLDEIVEDANLNSDGDFDQKGKKGN